MCGIIAYLGDNLFINIVNGLELLQNRGYDSAGICSINQKKYIINKLASSHKNKAIDQLKKLSKEHQNSLIGIGHTRWATHGAKTDINAHPHIDFYNTFAIVHNGIIENYLELKSFLEDKGFTFKSECDSEIIVNYLSYQYKIHNDTKISIQKLIEVLEGTYGIVILKLDDPYKMYCVRLDHLYLLE